MIQDFYKQTLSADTQPPTHPLLKTYADSQINVSNDLPGYNVVPPAPEPIYWHGKKNEASSESFVAGEEFTRAYPPLETLPPADHLELIKNNGVHAWRLSYDTSALQNLVTITKDGLGAKFLTKNDVTVQSNYPLFSLSESQSGVLHYFEITILSNKSPNSTTIAIGLCTKPYPSFRLPGWNLHSVGYHSDDGHKFNDAYGGRDYGPSWGAVGDTIGCGYYADTGFVFFTKNGEFLGNAFTGIRHVWFPSIGADGKCEVDVNFGSRTFVYSGANGFGASGTIMKM